MRSTITYLMKGTITVQLLLLTGLIPTQVLATNHPVNNWDVKDPFYDRSFIQNKGQFDPYGKSIFAASQNADFSMYFKNNGFAINQIIFEEANEAEIEREGKERETKTKEISIRAEFAGCSNNCAYSLKNKKTDSYGFSDPNDQKKTINEVSAYEKIIYNGLYPGIRAEFTFDPAKFGVKYCYYVEAGADPSVIKIKYENAQSLYIDSKGNLHVKKDEAEIMDLAPVAFSGNKTIKAAYKVDGKTVSIELEDYDHSKELIIDPFAINPAFTAQNKAFDCATDAAGNVYAFGGQNPWKLKKFSSAGTLIWTFNTTFSAWYGDLAVDLSGNSYITEGCCGGGIRKIANNNTVTWSQNYGTQEFWCLAFNCDYSVLYMAQGYASAPFVAQSMSVLNMNTGAVSGFTNIAASEPRALGWGPSNNMYVVTASGGNRTIGVNSAFVKLFDIPSGHNWLYNGPTYANGSNPTSGQNGVAAGLNFFCTTDGLTVFKRNLTTGALLGTFNVPGGVAQANSGILIDACDNIYVGSSTGIYKYDSNLNLITNAPTAGAVYCLYPARSGGEVIGCGNGFLGSYALNYQLKNFTVTVNTQPAGCSCAGTGSATVTFSCNPSAVSYSWSTGATTSSIGGLCPGNYWVKVNSNCLMKDSVGFTIGGSVANLTVNTTIGNANCTSSVGTVTITSVTNGTPNYTIAEGSSTIAANVNVPYVINNVSVGSHTYTVYSANGCTATAVVNILNTGSAPQLSITTPVIINCNPNTVVLNASSTTTGAITFTWTGPGILAGGSTPNPTVNVVGNYTVSISNGACITTSVVSVIGNTNTPNISITQPATLTCTNLSVTITGTSTSSGVTYQWVGGPTTNTFNVNTSGSYTLIVTNTVSGCQSSSVVVVTQNTLIPNIGINVPAILTCTNSSVILTGTSSSGGVTYQWTGGPSTNTFNVSSSGNYSLTVTDPANGCTSSSVVSVGQNTLVPDVGIVTPGLLNCTITAVVLTGTSSTGGVVYQWTGGPSNSNYTVNSAGNYSLLVTNPANGCTNTAVMAVIQNTTAPDISISPPATLTCFNPNTTLTGSSTVNGVTYQWSNGPSTNSYGVNTIGTYTLTVTDPTNGCSNSSVTTVSQFTTQPNGQIISGNNKACLPLCTTFTLQSSPPTAACSWNFGNGSSATGSVTSDNCFTEVGVFTITSTFTDIYGCIGTASYTVEVYPKPIADFNYSPIKPIVNEDEVTFTDASHGANVVKWDWYFKNLPKPHSGQQNPIFSYDEAGTYAIALVVRSDHGCIDTIVKTIVVGEDYGIYVPNVFTPNGDGVNDVFQPKGYGITKYELRIFNRWGEELMFTNDFYQGWDGIYKGKLSQEDTYIWKINLTNVFGKSRELTGHVTLIK